jgi:hypothetical protein
VLGVELIPTGELAGRPALQVQAGQLDWSDPTVLVRAVLQRRTAGVHYVQLIGAPWGLPALEAALTHLGADPRTAHLAVWLERECSLEGWSGFPWLVLDVSALLARPVTVPKLVQLVQLMPPVPTPVELVVRSPDPGLGAAHLDELTTRLCCETGWVYADPAGPVWQAAEVAISQAVGQWGLRALQTLAG